MTVQARITKFGPKVQNTLVKVPVVLREIDLDLQVHILPNSELEVCPHDISSSVPAIITKFGPEVQNNLVMMLLFMGVIPRPLHGPDCYTVANLCMYTDLGSHG